MTALDPCVLRVPLVRAAACADSTNAVRSHLEPLRVFPEKRLPADSLLPGHMPAQEAFRRPLGGEQIRQESPFIPARLPGATRSSFQSAPRGGAIDSNPALLQGMFPVKPIFPEARTELSDDRAGMCANSSRSGPLFELVCLAQGVPHSGSPRRRRDQFGLGECCGLGHCLTGNVSRETPISQARARSFLNDRLRYVHFKEGLR